MGIAMGTTAILIIHSPMGKRSGAHFNPAITLTYFRLGQDRDLGCCLLCDFPIPGRCIWSGRVVDCPRRQRLLFLRLITQSRFPVATDCRRVLRRVVHGCAPDDGGTVVFKSTFSRHVYQLFGRRPHHVLYPSVCACIGVQHQPCAYDRIGHLRSCVDGRVALLRCAHSGHDDCGGDHTSACTGQTIFFVQSFIPTPTILALSYAVFLSTFTPIRVITKTDSNQAHFPS
jgi:hypothetical protein